LEYDTVALYFFTAAADPEAGRFGIHRAIKEEGIVAGARKSSGTSNEQPNAFGVAKR